MRRSCCAGLVLTPGSSRAATRCCDGVAGGELTDAEIREAISGQICRCTSDATIVRSIRSAAERERVQTKEEV